MKGYTTYNYFSLSLLFYSFNVIYTIFLLQFISGITYLAVYDDNERIPQIKWSTIGDSTRKVKTCLEARDLLLNEITYLTEMFLSPYNYRLQPLITPLISINTPYLSLIAINCTVCFFNINSVNKTILQQLPQAFNILSILQLDE